MSRSSPLVRVRALASAFATALAMGASVGAASAQTTPPAASAATVSTAATTSCANVQLPLAILAGAPAKTGTLPALPVVTVGSPRSNLQLAVADDAHARELGLMCVTHLRRSAGMLFVFDTDETYEFWMKRTLVPLDMLWVAADGTVRSVQANVPAASLTTADDKVARRTGKGLYVIELNAGEAKLDGIAAGTKLHVPSLAPK
jgi:uncharacterized protein